MVPRYSKQSGFTLVELLVALFIAAFMLALLFNGLATANSRAAVRKIQSQSLQLAVFQLEKRVVARSLVSEISGTEDSLDWKLTEEEIARDPRGRFQLVRSEIRVGDASNTITLKRRFLREIP